MEPSNLKQLTVAQLKKHLEERGLSSKGTKAVLVERLLIGKEYLFSLLFQHFKKSTGLSKRKETEAKK